MIPTFEAVVRLAAFALVFTVLALWELWRPRRPLVAGRKGRWPNNLGILVVDVLVVRVLIPTAVVGAALFAAGNGWGLLRLAELRLRSMLLSRRRSRASGSSPNPCRVSVV